MLDLFYYFLGSMIWTVREEKRELIAAVIRLNKKYQIKALLAGALKLPMRLNRQSLSKLILLFYERVSNLYNGLHCIMSHKTKIAAIENTTIY